ncbi:MAG: PQQ-like beta-propeller repeat protein [Labilithrix sp.]|nr:PQQ-like beta-propeller repeat protein [Labilithrix sp.]MCW5834893.1 PQQ-like beta-propeller repeat protein [Labilithrix sp.]
MTDAVGRWALDGVCYAWRVALTLRKILAGTFAVPAVALGFAACGLDVVGAGVDATGSTPTDGAPGATTPEAEGGAPPDAAGDADAAPGPETCSWPGSQRGAPWPMIGGCVGHAGRTAHRGPKAKPEIVWETTISTRETHPVIGADDTVFVPANVDGLLAFDPDGGRRPFAESGTGVANNVTNVPSIGVDGTLYFGAERNVVAHRKSGTYWRFATGGEIDTSAVVDEDGTVYCGSFSDRLFALSPDGGQLWEKDLGSDIWAAVAIGPTGELYVGAGSRLYALKRDGGESWSYATTGEVRCAAVVADDGTIYAGTLGSRLHAVHPDGGPKWTTTTRGDVMWQALPALAKDGTIYAATSSWLAAFDPADGSMKWEVDTGVPLRTAVVVDPDGDIYVGGDKKMFAYAPDGARRWEVDIGANPFGFAIGRDGTVFVAANDNKLFALHE